MSKKRSTAQKAAAWAMAAVLGVSGLGSITADAADTTVTGEGVMNYVDLSQYTQVLLPTAATMRFALDPQGLSAISGDEASTSSLVADSGKIVSNGEVSIANYGYYPVKASVKLYVTDTGKSVLVSSPSDIDTDTSRKVCLTVTPSSTATTISTDADGKITGTTGYTASGEEAAVTQTAASSAKYMVYALSGADYKFKKETDASTGKVTYSAERDTAGSYGAASFKIGGAINKNADWAPYIAAKDTKSLKLNAVFSYTTMTNEEYAYLKGTDAADTHIQAGTYNLIADAAPEVSVATFNYDPERGGTLPLSLGTGASASAVTGVTLVKHTTRTQLADASDVSVKDEKISIKGFSINTAGTALNIPVVPSVKRDLDKIDITDPSKFDAATSSYTMIAYEDDTYNYEYTYDVIVTFADKTTATVTGVTMIKYQAPTMAYTGAVLAKAANAAANKAIAANLFTVSLGNGGAAKIVKAALNVSKTTAEVSNVDDTKVTVDASGTSIAIAASAFSYKSGTDETKIVYTVTFDSGEKADVEIPVAK